MKTKNFLQPLSHVEMKNVYGGVNLKAVLGTVKGSASIYGGLILGNPIAIISGCLETGYNIGKIFDD